MALRVGYTIASPETVGCLQGAYTTQSLLKDLITDDDALLDHVESQGYHFESDLYRERLHKDEPVRVRLPWDHVKKREVEEPKWFLRLRAYERPIVCSYSGTPHPWAAEVEDAEAEWTDEEEESAPPTGDEREVTWEAADDHRSPAGIGGGGAGGAWFRGETAPGPAHTGQSTQRRYCSGLLHRWIG
jgi:hypothetical protein